MTAYARTEVTLITLLGGAVTVWLAVVAGFWALLPALVTLALLSFYRDPPRRIPPGDDLLVSPTDGKNVDLVRAHYVLA